MENLVINRYLDAAILKPELTEPEVQTALAQCLDYQVKSVCVRPCDIELAVSTCQGASTEVGCVLSFPHGVGLTKVKAYEAEQYLALGVNEIDMVANYGAIRAGQWTRVEQDIAAVSRLTQPAGVMLKVILETALLTPDEISQATVAAAQAGADFVKTSTGFTGGGATIEAVQCMLRAAAGRIKVKASGGIRDYRQAKLFVDMGCQRLGVNYASLRPICDPDATGGDSTMGY